MINKKYMTEDFVDNIATKIAEQQYDPWTAKLAEPDAISVHKLLANRVIWMPDVVDDNLAAPQRQIMIWNMEDFALKVEERKPIILLMMNWGGDAERCWSFIDTMQKSTTPVYTVNLGVCGSAGAYIFMAGHKRFMMPRANVMIHEGSAQMQGDAQKVEQAQAAYKKMLKDANAYVLESTKIPENVLKKHKADDWYLYADDCIKYGVCDKIVENLDEVLNVGV